MEVEAIYRKGVLHLVTPAEIKDDKIVVKIKIIN